jgi:peptide/nickel transport system substrate-binding protein
LKLKVFLAGRVAVESDGVLIDEQRFPGRQGRLLFAYLVAEQGRPVPRDELADALWGEAPPATSDKALTVLASKLRGLLADRGIDGGKALTSAFGSYRLSLPEGTWVDIIAAADALHEAEAALAADDLEQAKAAARRAASLAQPSFLPGEEGAWVDAKRRELADILRRALSFLAEACLRSGDAAEAAHWAEETIALEPYRETGYRHLMAAHAAAGNRAEALRVYEQCRQLLATELGAYPSPETESIYRELLEAPAPEPRAATTEAAPVPVPEGEPLRSEAPAPTVAPRYRQRRAIAVGALAGVIAAAVAIPLFAFGGEGASQDFGKTPGVGVLDAGSGDVRAAAKLPEPPTAVAVGFGYVWAASADSNAVYVIDPETNTKLETIEVGNAPGGIAVGGDYVWVTNSLDGTVSQIDPRAQIELQRIPVGNGPTGVDVGGDHVWVANTSDHTVSKIRASTGKPLKTYSAGTDPGAVAVGEGAVWIASKSSDTVLKLNARDGQMLRTIHVGHNPAAVAVGLGSVWVANSGDGTVTQIDPASDTEIHREKVGAGPSGIGIVHDEVWTTNEFARTISRIDPAERLPTTIPVGRRLRPSAVAARNGAVYVALRPTGLAHRGGTLTFTSGSFEPLKTVDLAVGSLSSLWRFAALTNDGLLAYRHVGGQAGNQLVPDLARSMPEISDGGKTYRFQLRRNIRYSNGRRVRARDFRYAIERVFKLRPPNPDAAAQFLGIRGADRCRQRSCNLAAGIVADDRDRTITFHLSAPDPSFLYRLTFAAVPAGTPSQEATRQPLPATGPYRIVSFTRDSVRLERNPRFRQWSEAAQPHGFPDEIVLKAVPPQKGIALVERHKADLTSSQTLRPFIVAPTSTARKHEHPLSGMPYLVLDPGRPPFDDPRARRALNYALDREKVVLLTTKEGLRGRPTCQVLPPNFPGHRRYCPYTLDPSPVGAGAWTAPDPAQAARLVAASGTAGASVTLWVDPNFAGTVRVGRYLKRLLTKLRYRPQLRESFEDTARDYFIQLEQGVMSHHGGPQVAYAGWSADYPAASNFIQTLFSCGSKYNYSRYCDRALDRRIRRAVRLEQTDPLGANRLWAELDHEITDKALLVPLYNGSGADLVSKRVRNYQYNPQYGPLLSQLWVR